MKKRETRGRKKNVDKGMPKKISKGIYVYPDELKKIIEKHGSLSAFFDKCLVHYKIR